MDNLARTSEIVCLSNESSILIVASPDAWASPLKKGSRFEMVHITISLSVSLSLTHFACVRIYSTDKRKLTFLWQILSISVPRFAFSLAFLNSFRNSYVVCRNIVSHVCMCISIAHFAHFYGTFSHFYLMFCASYRTFSPNSIALWPICCARFSSPMLTYLLSVLYVFVSAYQAWMHEFL